MASKYIIVSTAGTHDYAYSYAREPLWSLRQGLKTHLNFILKSDAILLSNLAPLGSPFRSPFGFKKRIKITAKISPIFESIFGPFWVPKGFQNGGQNPSLEPQSRPRNPYRTLRTPTLAPKAPTRTQRGLIISIFGLFLGRFWVPYRVSKWSLWASCGNDFL